MHIGLARLTHHPEYLLGFGLTGKTAKQNDTHTTSLVSYNSYLTGSNTGNSSGRGGGSSGSTNSNSSSCCCCCCVVVVVVVVVVAVVVVVML